MSDVTGRVLPTPNELDTARTLAIQSVLPFGDTVLLAETHLSRWTVRPHDLMAACPFVGRLVDVHQTGAERKAVVVGYTPAYAFLFKDGAEDRPPFGFAILLPYVQATPLIVLRFDSRQKAWAAMGKWIERAQEYGIARDLVIFRNRQ